MNLRISIYFYRHNIENGFGYKFKIIHLLFGQHKTVRRLKEETRLIFKFNEFQENVSLKIHSFPRFLPIFPFRLYSFYDAIAKRSVNPWFHLEFIYRWSDLYEKQQQHKAIIRKFANCVRVFLNKI